MLFASAIAAQKIPARSVTITWKLAAQLPPSNGQKVSLGFAGAINGISNDVLIVAGGANFPNGLPWNGGKKYYSDEMRVLQKKGNNFVWNEKTTNTLPEPLAYCGVTSAKKGIVCVGGENEHGISNKAVMLNWNAAKSQVQINSLPNLPEALTNVSVTSVGNKIYVAGGDKTQGSSNRFFSLELNKKNASWQTLPDLPIAVANASLVAQAGSGGNYIYLIGGRTKTASGISVLRNTTYAYDLTRKTWKKCADIFNGQEITNLSAAAAVPLEKNLILVIGGDNGKIFHDIETHISRIAHATTAQEKERLTAEKNNLSIHHKGFDKSLLLYNTISDAWTKIGEYPFPAQVTTGAVIWENDIIISNGEIKPGVRTPDIITGKIN